MNLYRSFFKRAIDMTASGCALLVLALPLTAVTLWLHFANKGAGAFFLQERPGKDGKIFRVVKFKSMTDEKDANGNLLPDEMRMTKIGHFIRHTSIDELPQLWNVFKGDMSLIGPRPLLPRFLPLYSKYHARRHEIRPGITGWAQVNGRGDSKLSQKFGNDVWYVDHVSFSLDCKIIWKTVINVLRRKNIGEDSFTIKDLDDIGFLDGSSKTSDLE